MTAPGSMAEGTDTLRVFDFGLLFQALAQSLKVGVLKVMSRQGEKFLHFSRGRLKAVYTRRSKIRLGRVLFNMRAIEQADLARVLEEQRAGKFRRPLGEELLARGLVSRENLAAAVLHQMTEELLEIFYWREYSYEFFSGPVERVLEQLKPEYTRVGGDQDVQELLLNVSRIVDEIEKFNRITPSLRDIYELAADPEEILAGSDPDGGLTDILRLVDGQRDIRDIIRDMRMNRFEVLELLCELRTQGWIRPKNAFELLMLAENQRRALPPEKLVRIYERVRELGVEGFDVTLRLAQVHAEAGNGTLAADFYEKHARNCLAEGDYAGAESSARRAVELSPDSLPRRGLLVTALGALSRAEEEVAELLAMADLSRRAGDHREETVALGLAMVLRPDDAGLLDRYAEALAGQGRARAAAGALLSLARRRGETGDRAGAEQALRRATGLRPRAPRARLRLVEHLLRGGQVTEAAEEARLLVPLMAEVCGRRARKPDRHLLGLARRLRAQGLRDLEVTLLIAESLSRGGSDDTAKRIFADAASSLAGADRLAERREVLARAAAAFPDDGDLRESLAETLVEAGQAREALEVLAGLARRARTQGDLPAADRLYRRMLRASPVCPEALEGLAEVLLAEGKEADAAGVLVQVGDLYRATGDASRAAEKYDHACRLSPGEPRFLRALAEALSESLGMAGSAGCWERLMQALSQRGEHAAAIEAGLRIVPARGRGGDLARDLEVCYRALGARLREVAGAGT